MFDPTGDMCEMTGFKVLSLHLNLSVAHSNNNIISNSTAVLVEMSTACDSARNGNDAKCITQTRENISCRSDDIRNKLNAMSTGGTERNINFECLRALNID